MVRFLPSPPEHWRDFGNFVPPLQSSCELGLHTSDPSGPLKFGTTPVHTHFEREHKKRETNSSPFFNLSLPLLASATAAGAATATSATSTIFSFEG